MSIPEIIANRKQFVFDASSRGKKGSEKAKETGIDWLVGQQKKRHPI